MNHFAMKYLYSQVEVASEVRVEVISIGNVDGLAIVAVSSNYDPEELDFYIEEFLGYFEGWLKKM